MELQPETDGRPRPDRDRLAGAECRPGDRVRIWPRVEADILDLALKGKEATIMAIDWDFEDQAHVAVTVDDDPGRDLGLEGRPGHRFYFRPEELEPIGRDD